MRPSIVLFTNYLRNSGYMEGKNGTPCRVDGKTRSVVFLARSTKSKCVVSIRPTWHRKNDPCESGIGSVESQSGGMERVPTSS